MNRVADVWTTEGAKFAAFDRLLDARATGPQWLTRLEIAQSVIDVLLAGQRRGFFELGSWVVMPNHIHVLLDPSVEVSRIVSGVKASSAREANRILNRTGAFWSRDYFDRFVRDSADEQRIVRYIENNPVKAGLCHEPADWPFSSATAKK